MKKIYDFIVRFCKRVIKYDDLRNENEAYRKEILESKKKIEDLEKKISFGWPNGHYYSPVHNLEDLNEYEKVVKRSRGKFFLSLPGFSEKRMIRNYSKLNKYFKDFDYPKKENGKTRFYIQNCSYPITDALVLFSMIRDLKPKRIIEIGSGFTSALMIDVNERFFNNSINIKFVEPYPELLLSRMKEEDKKKFRIIPKKAQEVPLKIFKELEKGDILFIDSTHVSKFNSDVNYELFDILPLLKPGVIIHFHDVFDGFEYPLVWLKDGWAWNENYLLRAFLSDNLNYEVILMNDYLTKRSPRLLLKSYTRVKNLNGGGLWIRKVK